MKLPENKQERTKIFIMIGLGAVLVILGIVQGIINPLRKSRQSKFVRMQECETEIQRARSDIKAAARSFAHRMDTLQEIRDISDQHILHPVLGNYLLQATEIIETHAQELGIAIEPVREVGISDIPADSKTSSARLLKAYTVRINMIAPYHDAIRLIRAIEQSNPYVCITSIIIEPRPAQDPQRHSISIEVQWPIWANPEFPKEINEQLKEEITKTDSNTAEEEGEAQ